MTHARENAIDRAYCSRFAGRAGGSVVGCVGLALVLIANEACAAALDSLATSVGLFAALAALFVAKGWPLHLPASALSTAGGALVIAGGAAWFWRSRLMGAGRLAGVRRGAVSRVAVGPACRCQIALPPGVEREVLLIELRGYFMRLQEAWDGGVLSALNALTTTEMLAELRLGLPASTANGAPSRSEVVTLDADLLGFDEWGETFLVTVEFSGLMRDSPESATAPFRELWMLTKPKDGASNWKLARHQTLI